MPKNWSDSERALGSTSPIGVEFEHMGLPCLITRHPEMGNLCGYCAVLPGHPWHGKYGPPVSVHGTCNYASVCDHRICHTPKPGDPDNVWWFGFDCGHGFDLSPGYLQVLKLDPAMASPIERLFSRNVYRDFAYVESEVLSLAEQLNALGKVGP